MEPAGTCVSLPSGNPVRRRGPVRYDVRVKSKSAPSDDRPFDSRPIDDRPSDLGNEAAIAAQRWQQAEAIVQRDFGHESLLPAQRKVLDRVFQGHNVLAVMPTGHGKSLCYQLPSQVLDGLTIVVSPLISLMKDQCDALVSKGIKAARLDNSISHQEFAGVWQSVHAGQTKLLYLAPERFFNERFAGQLQQTPVSLLAIDEAHCMSQWGHHFRPDYRRLPELVSRLSVGQVLALTATATPAVIKDIRSSFQIATKDVVRLSAHRGNLRLRCTAVDSNARDEVLLQRLGVTPGQKKRKRKRSSGATLIYVTRRITADQLAELLAEHGIEALVYHAGLNPGQRDDVQRQFLESKDAVLIGTVAFGMGVDKPDIRQVIHYNPSQSIESYSQEVGRGGRDGKACQCEVLLCKEDQVTLMNLAASDLPSESSMRQLVDRLIGQPDQFYLALGKLGWEINLSPETIATAMLRLQTAGYLRCLSMRYDKYRVTPVWDRTTILAKCDAAERPAVEAILSSLSKGKKGFRVNLTVTSQQYKLSRAHLIEVLERGAINQLWHVTSTDSMSSYEWIKPIKRPRSVVRLLWKDAHQRFGQSLERIGELMSFLACDACLSIQVAGHFGHRRSRPCGRCSFCLGEGPIETSLADLATNGTVSIGTSAMGVLERITDQYPDVFGDPVDQAKFLCGLSTPTFRRYRIYRDPGYGVCDQVPITRVLAAITPSNETEKRT
ncbi:ATP-dependent DNA helicase, RecQ-like [Neorhodopirellula lusitana]|uniref:DNA 3'-5' helicase n=1 Tax=Neorhodopirellula lusitana TaxID=445327 RepID=A0ABY1PUP1_9BACT|nr:ATP-dependent DNA helicase, RecQ-like [Neorhodopirellula lusitana]